MKLRDIASQIRAEVLSGEELLDDIDIECAYGADLMSDVLAFARPGSLLLTGLTNIQIVRTAQMLDLPAVVFVRGKK
ncbi:MAG TPA: transcriptional regulator, partial [Synergistales bacterium]|nr:transcriptional regulator [Synergistales bacterium]